jgi:hypothetical protein
MTPTFKITTPLLSTIRADLARSHAFAYERVGFLTAGAWAANDELYLLARAYLPVDDAHYVETDSVGAEINVDAMRKAVQTAYRSGSALFHIHAHLGTGVPDFSRVDLRSGRRFVPSFFNLVPQMPHGMIVLSDDSANGLVWLAPHEGPQPLDCFVSVGARLTRMGRAP